MEALTRNEDVEGGTDICLCDQGRSVMQIVLRLSTLVCHSCCWPGTKVQGDGECELGVRTRRDVEWSEARTVQQVQACLVDSLI